MVEGGSVLFWRIGVIGFGEDLFYIVIRLIKTLLGSKTLQLHFDCNIF